MRVAGTSRSSRDGMYKARDFFRIIEGAGNGGPDGRRAVENFRSFSFARSLVHGLCAPTGSTWAFVCGAGDGANPARPEAGDDSHAESGASQHHPLRERGNRSCEMLGESAAGVCERTGGTCSTCAAYRPMRFCRSEEYYVHRMLIRQWV